MLIKTMQNGAKKSSKMGNELVSELLLFFAFFCLFTLCKRSKTAQNSAIYQQVTLIFVLGERCM